MAVTEQENRIPLQRCTDLEIITDTPKGDLFCIFSIEHSK
jgi:hypothetical protein